VVSCGAFFLAGIAVELAERGIAVFLGPSRQTHDEVLDLFASGLTQGLTPALPDHSSTSTRSQLRALDILRMKKDARLTFRIRSDLKKDVEENHNSRRFTVLPKFEAFFAGRVRSLQKQGSRFVRRMLVRLINKASTY
jgi:hypothetical protein